MDPFWTFAFYLAAAIFLLYSAVRACFKKNLFPSIDFTALGLFMWVMVILWAAGKAWK